MTTANSSSPNLSKADLSLILQTARASVTFTKKDGSTRVMLASLLPTDIVPYERKTTDRELAPNDAVLPVWDCEANAWRAITVANVQSIDVVIGA